MWNIIHFIANDQQRCFLSVIRQVDTYDEWNMLYVTPTHVIHGCVEDYMVHKKQHGFKASHQVNRPFISRVCGVV